MIGDLLIVDRDLFFAIEILLTVSKMIAISIGDRKATIAIGDLFLNGDRDRDRDLKFDQDRDRHHDRNFRDRGHALSLRASITFRFLR